MFVLVLTTLVTFANPGAHPEVNFVHEDVSQYETSQGCVRERIRLSQHTALEQLQSYRCEERP